MTATHTPSTPTGDVSAKSVEEYLASLDVATAGSEASEPTEQKAARYVWAATRISIGSVFLWAFADKLFGLSHSTVAEKSWLNGGSPTTGFLKGVQGPLAEQFHAISGQGWADWLFMMGLLGIGVALIAGIGMRVAAASGVVMLVLMWAASLPIKTHIFMDDHLVYALVLVGLALIHAGDTLGLGKVWSKLPIVKRIPALR